MDARTVAIDSKDLESGIEALSSAGRAFRLTLFEKCAYYALMASVYVTGWSFVAVIFLAIIDTLFEWNVTVLGEAAAGIVFLGAGFAIVALALNMPLAYKLYRERALLKQLGLASLSKSLWKESRRGRWISRVFRWAALIMLVVSVPVMAIDHYSRGREWDAGVYLVLLSTVAVIVLLTFIEFLRNQHERIDLAASAEKLSKALQGMQQRAGKAEIVSVPSEILEQAARIESAQIAKERRDAVLQSVSVGPSGYAVTFDRAAAEQRRMLDVPDRVELEDRVAQLSIEGPDKLTSQAGPPEGATRRCETKNKRFEFEYVIDRASRGIRIIAVRRQDRSNSSLKGASHV